jgi:hypothetical protein
MGCCSSRSCVQNGELLLPLRPTPTYRKRVICCCCSFPCSRLQEEGELLLLLLLLLPHLHER